MQRRLRAAIIATLVAGLPLTGSSLVGLCLVGSAALCPGTALAETRPLTVDDILRLHAAGVDEDIIISEIVVTDTVFDLDVDDLLRLQEAGISDRLLQFMVDTGRDVSADTAAAGDDVESAPADTAATPETAYVEEQVVRPVYVSLRWNYPWWWYDYYWDDYWYYDCSYDPWLVAWTYPCGVWYPAWYWNTRCWAPAGFGYRYSWWTGRGYGWQHVDGYHHSGYAYANDGRHHELSRRKYKAGGGSTGKIALGGGAGLKGPDGTRLAMAKPVRLLGRTDRVALDTHRNGDIRRIGRVPTKTPADRGDTIRRPAISKPEPGDAVRRPARPVRTPAPADHPVKHVVRRTGTKAAPAAPTDRGTRAPVAGKPAPENPSERPAPAPHPERPPRVESRPAPKSSPASPHSGGKSPRTESGTSGSGKSRGR